jgi:hypothetical protein
MYARKEGVASFTSIPLQVLHKRPIKYMIKPTTTDVLISKFMKTIYKIPKPDRLNSVKEKI